MLSKEDNELVCRVGPGTPGGALLRRYWLPALLVTELPGPDCDPIRVRLLGEDLVAFRDTEGRIGLVGAHCPHRGASLFFGRNEENGLRCVYHGWKFDVTGRCVDMPNEPPESSFKDKIKHTSYPCVEQAGVVWTYMGPPERRPPMLNLEWMRLPAGHRWVSKTYERCNWLQALEGGIDTSHSSFLIAARTMSPSTSLSFAHGRAIRGSRCWTPTTASPTRAFAIWRMRGRTTCACINSSCRSTRCARRARVSAPTHKSTAICGSPSTTSTRGCSTGRTDAIVARSPRSGGSTKSIGWAGDPRTCFPAFGSSRT